MLGLHHVDQASRPVSFSPEVHLFLPLISSPITLWGCVSALSLLPGFWGSEGALRSPMLHGKSFKLSCLSDSGLFLGGQVYAGSGEEVGSSV